LYVVISELPIYHTTNAGDNSSPFPAFPISPSFLLPPYLLPFLSLLSPSLPFSLPFFSPKQEAVWGDMSPHLGPGAKV